jgi:hypothetical protein
MHVSRLTLACVVLGLLASGCQRRTGIGPEPQEQPAQPAASPNAPAPTPSTTAGRRAQASRRPPAGMTCTSRESCTSDQVCVDGRCRYRETSVAGEVLAAAAEGQAEAGDWNGALETYEQAFAAFERQRAPVPPEIACSAAELALRTATDAEGRERGARRADLCFRITLPGDPGRQAVRRALARLRFEGLEIRLFDQEEPAESFFTQQPSRPTVDAVAVEVQMPDLEPRETPAHTAIRTRLQSDEGRAAIAECFLQEWEVRHGRSATANLALAYSTRVVDLGDYDDYEPVITVGQTTTAQDGFEPCLAAALPNLFDTNNRSLRGGTAWNQTVRVTAHVQ